MKSDTIITRWTWCGHSTSLPHALFA